MPKVSNQLKDFLFRLSCFHISFCKSEWGRGQVSERREEKANTVCYNMCQQNGWKRRWLGMMMGGEWMRKNNNSQLKKRKIKSVHFPHFSDGLVCGEERENRLYIGSFVCRRTSSFFRESTRFSHPNALMCVCVCEWEKFIILKGGLVAKNMCICKAIFKRLLLFLGTVQCCWMSGAKGILQNDIYEFFFSLACICCCCSLKEVNEFYNLIKSSIHSIVIHICSCRNAHIIAVVVPHSKWNDFQNGFKLCTHINADDTLSSSLLLLFL